MIWANWTNLELRTVRTPWAIMTGAQCLERLACRSMLLATIEGARPAASWIPHISLARATWSCASRRSIELIALRAMSCTVRIHTRITASRKAPTWMSSLEEAKEIVAGVMKHIQQLHNCLITDWGTLRFINKALKTMETCAKQQQHQKLRKNSEWYTNLKWITTEI